MSLDVEQLLGFKDDGNWLWCQLGAISNIYVASYRNWLENLLPSNYNEYAWTYCIFVPKKLLNSNTLILRHQSSMQSIITRWFAFKSESD